MNNLTESKIKEEIISLGFDHAIFNNTNINTGIHLQQNPDEIAKLMHFLIQRFKDKSITYLEVGSASGGTCFVMNKYLKIMDNFIVDNNQHPKHGLRNEVLKMITFKQYIGDSNSEAAKKFAEFFAPFDIVFIDAGHLYHEVKKDIENYANLVTKNGVVLFHDKLAVPDVKKAVDEMMTPDKWSNVFECNIQFGLAAYQRV